MQRQGTKLPFNHSTWVDWAEQAGVDWRTLVAYGSGKSVKGVARVKCRKQFELLVKVCDTLELHENAQFFRFVLRRQESVGK